LPLGCAVNAEGYVQASMGIGVGDYDRNGWLDLYVGHFTKDYATLFANVGEAGFQDVSRAVGSTRLTGNILTFGIAWEDFNQDGYDDFVLANGHIDDWRYLGEEWEMNPKLFTFDGRELQDGSSQAGNYFQHKYLGRSVAQCDYDDDGDLDLVIVHQNKPAALLRNDSQRGHWLKLRFIGRSSNRRGINTRVELIQGDRRLLKELVGGASFCSTHQPVLVFGLGQAAAPCQLRIRWPRGQVQELSHVAVDQSLVLQEPETSVSQNTGRREQE
jgi:enediyne biosynthesis protein E4